MNLPSPAGNSAHLGIHRSCPGAGGNGGLGKFGSAEVAKSQARCPCCAPGVGAAVEKGGGGRLLIPVLLQTWHPVPINCVVLEGWRPSFAFRGLGRCSLKGKRIPTTGHISRCQWWHRR